MHESLRERCVAEALTIIDAEGIEALSLRDVARRLGVSHQAPYKHFESRDHLLAEIVRRAFASFARYLDARPTAAAETAVDAVPSAESDLEAMGTAYLAYARAHPLQYRLMFGTPLPDPAKHEAMMASARHAFSLLYRGLGRVHAEAGRAMPDDAVVQDGLFVWATLHGLASIRETQALATLQLPATTLTNIDRYVLARLGDALSAARAPQPPDDD